MKLGIYFVLKIDCNAVAGFQARLNTVSLVAKDVQGNYNISKVVDIFLTFFYI